MRFLRVLLTWFTKPQAPETNQFVADEGDIARFVFNRRDLFQDGRPKPKAFSPQWHKELDRYETSICGLNDVVDERLWFLGRTIRAQEGLSAIAALELPVKAVVSTGLDCISAPEPNYAEHGVIIGWNSDPNAKDERLAFQQDLAASVPASKVKRLPSTAFLPNE